MIDLKMASLSGDQAGAHNKRLCSQVKHLGHRFHLSPVRSIPDHGVEQHDHFAHAGNDRDFSVFALCHQSLVKTTSRRKWRIFDYVK